MSSVEELRNERPPEVGVARVLLIIAAVLWLPIAGNLSSSSTVGMVGLAMFFVVFGSFGAVKGRQAGRLMTTIALGVTLLSLLPYCWLGFRDSNPYGFEYALVDIAAVLLAAIAVALLYHPNSSRYIHLVTVARQAGRAT